jgi:Zn-dependent protease with chaperone function
MTSHKYTGGIYINDASPVRESGELIVQGATLIFKNDNRELSFNTAELKITFGGTAKRIAYLTTARQPNVTLHTSDFSLLQHPSFQSHTSAQKVVRDRKNHHRSHVLTFIFIALLVLVPSYFVFFERTLLAGLIASQVPIEQEQAFGDYIYDFNFGSNEDIIKDEAINADFQKLVAPLVAVAKDSGYTFKIHLMKSKDVNAFALPGGHIIVLTGLIEKSEKPEEVLGVLAHEIAHVTHRHSLKQTISELSGYMLLNIITMGAGDLVYAVGDNARDLLSKDYSRSQEQEADEAGFAYLLKANISPRGLITFFERLKEEETILDSSLTALIQTHPANDKRIENLNALLEKHGGEPPVVIFPYAQFKDRIAGPKDSK